MDRRDFLKKTAALAALGAVSKFAAPLEAAPKAVKKSGNPDIVVVRNGEPVEMFERLIKELGGMEKFVKPGQTVLVKPNIAWNQPPEMAANTNPDLVAAIITHCKKAGASKVYVFDTTCYFWGDTYKTSGIAEITIPPVFRSIRLHNAGANEFSALGLYSPFWARYA